MTVTIMDLRADVKNFQTTYAEGFLESEIKELLKKYQSIDSEKFNDYLFGVTCVSKKEGFVFYHIDVLSALRFAIETNPLYRSSWD